MARMLNVNGTMVPSTSVSTRCPYCGTTVQPSNDVMHVNGIMPVHDQADGCEFCNPTPSCGCGATCCSHMHHGHGCCGGDMCCPYANE